MTKVKSNALLTGELAAELGQRGRYAPPGELTRRWITYGWPAGSGSRSAYAGAIAPPGDCGGGVGPWTRRR